MGQWLDFNAPTLSWLSINVSKRCSLSYSSRSTTRKSTLPTVLTFWQLWYLQWSPHSSKWSQSYCSEPPHSKTTCYCSDYPLNCNTQPINQSLQVSTNCPTAYLQMCSTSRMARWPLTKDWLTKSRTCISATSLLTLRKFLLLMLPTSKCMITLLSFQALSRFLSPFLYLPALKLTLLNLPS